MWNPFRNPAVEAAKARMEYRETPEGQREEAREFAREVDEVRAEGDPQKAQEVRERWADPTYEPPDIDQYFITPEQSREIDDWADWAEEMRPASGDEASL